MSAPREAPRRFVECAYRRRRFVINITGEVPRAPPRGKENAVAAVTLRTSHHNVKYNKNGHVYALAKPKAGGDQRDFEFANYPAFLIVARD